MFNTGVGNSQRTCLHAVVSLVDGDSVDPMLAELSFQLIYNLCSNSDTSSAVLRYLRTSNDFFFRNISRLPFTTSDTGE